MSVKIKYTILIVANLMFSLWATIPAASLYYFLYNYPLYQLGLSPGDATENDGPTAVLLLVIPLMAISLIVWLLCNWGLIRWINRDSLRNWVVASLVTATPSFGMFGYSLIYLLLH